MLRFVFILTVLFVASGVALHGQTPTRSATVTPPTPTPTAVATASPSPSASAAPDTEALINSMNSADLQQAIQILKNNYINPEALSETELNRALLLGVYERLGRGMMILPEHGLDPTQANAPFFGEILDGHVGYLRLGALTAANLQALDANLQTLHAKKVDAVVIDLRASLATNDFAIAAEFANRFTPKGKPLFTLRKTAVKPERVFASDRDPSFQGLMIVLADGDTSGPAEAIAGVLRLYDKALLIGQTTAGEAVEYSDLPLNGGKMLRVAVAEAVLPEGRPLFPGGLKPDLPVEMSATDKRLIFQQGMEKGMGQFIFESERPHLNEAALLSGKNPDIEAIEALQKKGRPGEKTLLRDPVLQRAVDLVTSLAIYQQK